MKKPMKKFEPTVVVRFFGLRDTKQYYPIETINNFLASPYIKKVYEKYIEPPLDYFTNETEAKAQGYTPGHGLRCPDCGQVNPPDEWHYCCECGAQLEKVGKYTLAQALTPLTQYKPPQQLYTPQSFFSQGDAAKVFGEQDEDEYEDEDEDEDEEAEEEAWDEDTDEEDYFEEPPAFVYTPPSTTSAPRNQKSDRNQPAQGRSRLGTDIQTGEFVEVTQTARRQGLYILGLQGYGKSGLLENLIIQDITQHIGVCVLDPKGELIDNVIARLPDSKKEEKVILLDLRSKDYYAGLNLFDCADPTDDSAIMDTLSQVLHVFEKAFGVSQEATPRIYDYLFYSAYTLIDIPLVFNDDYRRLLQTNVTDAGTIKFWEDYMILPKRDQSDRARDVLRRFSD